MRHAKISLPLNDPAFSRKVFKKLGKTRVTEPLRQLIQNEAVEESEGIDEVGLQHSSSFRALQLARGLASYLVSDKGELVSKRLFEALAFLEKAPYSLGPGRALDDKNKEHVIALLRALIADDELTTAFKRISKPRGVEAASKLIKQTLLLSTRHTLKDADAKRAVLAALLTPLRQNVGSCFATAPAILIQKQSPTQLVNDLGQLIATGTLKRVINGVQHAVPLSATGSMADLLRSQPLSKLGKNPLKTLSQAPGLIAGFEAADLIKSTLSLKEKRAKLLQLLRKSTLNGKEETPFLWVNADALFRLVLMAHFELTEEDIEQHALQPKGAFRGSSFPAPLKRGGKAALCEKYKKGYEAACSAFVAMTDNALLKAWEFSLASLSETKAEFAKWNLHASLGLNAEEEYGIGRCFYTFLQSEIDKTNEEIEEQQGRYDHLFAALKSLEGRFAAADTDSKMSWIQAEYRTRQREVQRVLALRDEAHGRGQRLHALFPFLLNFYSEKFKEYFQEVYDAKMRDIEVSIYDDTPAGFRLLYKHGRTNPSLWTLIYTSQEYIDALSAFFVATEVELASCPETQGLQRELTTLVTQAVTLIKREEFLEASFYRLASAYREPIVKHPLQNMEKVKRKPWAYVSGGTMHTLVQTYFTLPAPPKESARWVESGRELLAFFIDTLKELPLSVQKQLEKEKQALLTYSPTHAFLLKPYLETFLQGWKSDLYTYTWIRNTVEAPGKKFLAQTRLDTRMMEHLRDLVASYIPIAYRSLFLNALRTFSYSMTPPKFREHIANTLNHERWVQSSHALPLLLEEVDSLLYGALPLFPEHQLEQKLITLFKAVDEVDETLFAKIMHIFKHYEPSLKRYTLISAHELRNIAKALLMLALKNTRSPVAFHQKLQKALQKNELAYPAPLLFADTNWVDNVFGFVIGPGTEELELWRFSPSGSSGRPIAAWQRYLNGTEKRPWGVFNAPREYNR